MLGWAVIVMMVSACRFGFSEVTPAVDGELPSGIAHVTVFGEEREAAAGQPIADAYVLVLDATGATTIGRTEADGTATVPLFGPSSIHVARPAPDLGEQHWLVYSFAGLDGDPEIQVGGRAPPVAAPQSMTVTVPAFTDAEITETRIRGPARCLDVDQAPTVGTTAVFSFAAACANEKVQLYAQGLGYGDPWMWTPLGEVRLASGTTIAAPTAWQDNEKYSIDYAGLPASVTDVSTMLALPAAHPARLPGRIRSCSTRCPTSCPKEALGSCSMVLR